MQGASAFDLQQPAFRLDAADRGKASRLASGREHAMTRHDDRERIATEGLSDGTRQTRSPRRVAISPYVSVSPGGIARVSVYTRRSKSGTPAHIECDR